MVLDERIAELKHKYHERRGRRPIFVLHHDEKVHKEWVNPSDRSSRAFDWEQNPGQQLFLEGYANPVQPKVVTDDDGEPTGEVHLIPSERYRQFMEQKIISDAVQGGGLSGEQIKYMTMANLGGIILLIIIVVAMLG